MRALTAKILVFVFLLEGLFSFSNLALSGSLTVLSDTLSNETASTVSNHTIVFTTPTGVAAGQTIILTFDNSTSVAAAMDYTDMDLLDDGVNVTLAATPTGTTWGAARTSATVITFTNGSSAVAAGSVITIKIGTNATNQSTGVRQITNGAAGTTTLVINGTFGDSGIIAIPVVATNSIVSIAATVLPTISFSVSANSIYFGALRTNSACFATTSNPGNSLCPQQAEAEAFNMIAATNGSTGYAITVQGPTLTSGLNTITALGSNTASSPGNEQFGIRLTATGGTGTVTVPYAAAGYAFTANASTPAQVASTTGPSVNTTYSVRYLANIATLTEAGTYSANHTYIATANF